MKTSKFYSIIKYNNGDFVRVLDEVVHEYGLDIYVDGERVTRLLCTPESLESLCVGFLKTAGLINRYEDVESICLDEETGKADIRLISCEERLHEEASAKEAGTGIQGVQPGDENFEFSKTSGGFLFEEKDMPDILRTAESFGRMSRLFEATGGVHSCAAGTACSIIVFEEDVGRHNALDKTVGRCMIEHIEPQELIIYLSGRVSSEMIVKAANAGFKAVVSRSAPTDSAIEIARKNGMLLCGFARGEKANIYSGFWDVGV